MLGPTYIVVSDVKADNSLGIDEESMFISNKLLAHNH